MKSCRRTAILTGTLLVSLLLTSIASAATSSEAERAAAGTLSGVIQLFTQPEAVPVRRAHSPPDVPATRWHVPTKPAPTQDRTGGLRRADTARRRARICANVQGSALLARAPTGHTVYHREQCDY